MDGVDALLLRQRDDALDVEVGLDRPLALADLVGLVGLEAVQAEGSSCEKTATVRSPSSVAARMMRMAISPRFSARVSSEALGLKA